jgi:hypothetical protein
MYASAPERQSSNDCIAPTAGEDTDFSPPNRQKFNNSKIQKFKD